MIDGGVVRPDDRLPSWQEVTAGFAGWQGLLLGNGLSRSVCGDFGYPFLFEKAPRGDAGLTEADCRLFDSLDTRNFERVLAELAAAIRMAEALNRHPGPYLERYRSIQQALGRAIQAVHVDYFDVPRPALEAIGQVLQEQRCVFTTSYDLIVYWAMGAVDYEGLCDCFWDGERFDPDEPESKGDLTPVYFLHGALHLIAMGSGVTRKRVNAMPLGNLLQQFGRPVRGDDQARPLFVTEGSAQHKLLAIEGNDYLSAALNQLREFKGPLVVFGSELSEQDRHLVDAINRHPGRPVAVSIYREDKTADRIGSLKALLRSRLDSEEIVCFDATTHPLGVAARSAVENPPPP
jgi:Domain of unknown function (DUF4917)